MSRAWLGVVSAAHVERGVSLGIAQLNHGKRAGLARLAPGDTLIYYSPTRERGDKTPYQCFTAIGIVSDGEIWQADDGDFKPYRRRVDYSESVPVPIADLKEELVLTSTPGWGYQLRFGLLPLDPSDFALIREAMVRT